MSNFLDENKQFFSIYYTNKPIFYNTNGNFERTFEISEKTCNRKNFF